MRKSDEIGQLATAAIAALKNVGHPIKNKKNPHFKNTYADLLAVTECTRDDLLNNGIWLMQVPDGTGISTMIVHESGEWVSFHVVMPEKPQSFGSGLTYLRRYGTQGVAMIVAEEDDDAEAAEGRSSNGKEDW